MDKNITIHSTKDDGDDYFIYNRWKKKYHFKIARFLVPTGMAYEALEVKEDDSIGYEFNSLYSLDDDQDLAMEEFLKKIKKGLNQKHIKKRGSEWVINSKNMLRGKIDWSEDLQDTAFSKVFIIDGKRITIEDFVRMIDSYEGWRFEFKIKDPSD